MEAQRLDLVVLTEQLNLRICHLLQLMTSRSFLSVIILKKRIHTFNTMRPRDVYIQ